MEDYILNVIGKVKPKQVQDMLEFLDGLYDGDFKKITAIKFDGAECKIYHTIKTITIQEEK